MLSNFRLTSVIDNRSTVDLVAQHGYKKDIVLANDTLIANCVLGGDIDVLDENGNVYQAVLKELNALSSVKKAIVKKIVAACKLLDDEEDGDGLQAAVKWNALLRREYGVDPDTLSDEEWGRLIQDQIYLRKLEDERFKNNLRVVLYELAKALYGGK